jgi:hypothetical protein
MSRRKEMSATSERSRSLRYLVIGAASGICLLFLIGTLIGVLTRRPEMTVIDALHMMRRSLFRVSLDTVTAFSMAALVGGLIGSIVGFIVNRRRDSIATDMTGTQAQSDGPGLN